MTDWQGSPPPPTDHDTTILTGDDAASSDLLEQLYRDKAALQRQLDDERRLRREAEDIIDQRQDEVFERDALVRALREELRKSSSGSGSDHGHSGPDSDQRKAEPRSAPPPILPGPSPVVNPGLTKAQAKAAYAALLASIQSFVAARLAPVFAVPMRDLEAATAAVRTATDAEPLTPATPTAAAAAAADASASPPAVPSTYHTMARPRVLLRFMTPRARMFLRLKGADSVHFYAILIEFLRRRVFDEPYGGIFKLSGGPVPPLLLGDYDLGVSPTTTTPPTSPPTTTREPNSGPQPTTTRVEGKRYPSGPWPLNKVEARLERADGLARQLGALLHDMEAEPVSVRFPVPVPVSTTVPTTPPPPRPSRHPEARRFRVQLIDRILGIVPQTPSMGVVPETPPASATNASARLAALARYIDTRVVNLSADLSRALLPLEMARQVAEAVAATRAIPPTTTPTTTDAAARNAVDRRPTTYASLERVVAAHVVRPAVELAVALQLAVPEYSVRWLKHANDSPSLSVCEALGLDAQRIRFRGDKDDVHDNDDEGNDTKEEPYSFVFDITPALSMRDVDASNNGRNYVPETIIYAQGVLVQQGQVGTERTFVHWLHETGIKPKSESKERRGPTDGARK